jgi:hypothetical protein
MRLEQVNHETPSNSVWERRTAKLRFAVPRTDSAPHSGHAQSVTTSINPGISAWLRALE